MRHSWQFASVLLAILALAIANRGAAEQPGVPAGGSTASPNAGPGASDSPGSTSNQSARSYPISLDPRTVRFQRDLENADPVRQESASGRPLKELAASNGPDWSSAALSSAERTWITIFAAVGFFVMLAAGVYSWWSHIQPAQVDRAVLLPMKPETAAIADGPEMHDEIPKQRAA